MLNWLWKLFPQDWKFSVAVKKAAYTIGKLAIAILTMGKLKSLGDKMSPEQLTQLQTVIGGLTAAGLETLHDWFRLKYPDIKWL